MKSNKFFKKLAIFATSAIFSLPTMQAAQAAPGPLSPAPLFLSNIVEPNVFLTYDNSGSMAWVPVVDADLGFGFNSGRPVMGNTPTDGTLTTREWYNPEWDGNASNRNTIPPESSYPDAWMLRNHNGNKNYYNPDITYVPWAGTDTAGNPLYPQATATAARRHPHPGHAQYNTTTNLLIAKTFATAGDLYLPTYHIWNDDDGDGVIEPTDSHTTETILAGDADLQNFANWFVYYRTRELAAKASIGQVIFNADASRMGLGLLHQRSAPSRIVVGVESMTDADKKRALLLRFYSERSANGTPLRTTLEDVGDYFMSTGSSAPILGAGNGGECQQNFNILMTDGFWNGGDPSVGNADSNSGSGNTIFDGHSAFPPTAAESNDGGNYADDYEDTLADVAMHYYENDLRALSNNVPTQAGVDEADHQHLVNYTIAFGVKGTLDPLSTDPLLSDPLSKKDFWPEPDNNDPETIDDLWHAAYNSRGEFLSAQNPDTLRSALSQAISDIAERTATAAAVSINSAKLTQDAVVYLSEFNTNGWTGDLIAKQITDLDTGELEPGERWKAADELEARTFDAEPLKRVVLTHNGTDGVSFQWGQLTDAQKNDLRTNPAGGTDADDVAQDRLLYLRGKRDFSTRNFRGRNKRLGDIVNSAPVYVGKPALNWPDTFPFPDTSPNRYTDFKNGPDASRMEMVYAGANDGMLHGFRADNGREELAYISGNLFSTGANAGLHYLTDPGYIHRYYNDLTPTVSDIYADLNDGSGKTWRTILIGGQRGGGRGIYALNVTDPTLFSNDAAKAQQVAVWEFSSTDDPDLGFTYSKPQIGMTNDGSWVAIFGNGYNDNPLGDGEAKLFILKIEKGTDGNWDLNAKDYIKISTGIGDSGDRNGLATPALADLDSNGTIDRVYAGDLRGNMWAFDLSSGTDTDWEIPNDKPLFTTIGGLPITAQPTLSKHPTIADIPVPQSGANEPNIMVFFGSGQYLVNADKTSTNLDHFYGVWDRGDDELVSSNLVQQTLQVGFTNIDTGAAARVLSSNNVDYATGAKYGWYFTLPDSGERSITKPVVRGNVVFMNTFVPEDSACAAGGYGWRMAVDLETGGPPKQTTIDANNDGIIDGKDDAQSGPIVETITAIKQEGYLPEPVFIEDIAYTADTPSKVVELKDIATGRFSWQELLQ
jgi:type IV pilus assembly protein PilY1